MQYLGHWLPINLHVLDLAGPLALHESNHLVNRNFMCAAEALCDALPLLVTVFHTNRVRVQLVGAALQISPGIIRHKSVRGLLCVQVLVVSYERPKPR